MKLPGLAALTVVVLGCAREGIVAPAARPVSDLQVVTAAAAPRDSSQAPIFILDGVVIPEPVSGQLDSLHIKKVEVVKGRAAVAKYGPRGVNGVVIITTGR